MAGIQSNPYYEQYLSSLYWAVTTMMAVGYGDIHAYTDAERVYSMLAQFLGAMMYGVIIGTIAKLVESSDAKNSAFRDRVLSYLSQIRFAHHYL